MNGGESGTDKKENFKAEITFNMKFQYTSLCLQESLFSQVTDFFLTHAHLTFVYKLSVNNHKNSIK